MENLKQHIDDLITKSELVDYTDAGLYFMRKALTFAQFGDMDQAEKCSDCVRWILIHKVQNG